MSSLIEPRTPAVPATPNPAAGSSADREQPQKRLEQKNKLRADLVAYVVFNLALIVVWALPAA